MTTESTDITDGTPSPKWGFDRRRTLTGLFGAGAVAVGATILGRSPVSAAAPPGTPPFVQRTFVSINVKDYGALGDGKTDDSKAIQAAVNDALSSNRPVFFPSGTYVVTTALQAGPGPLRLIGEGMWMATILCTSTNSFFASTTTPDSLDVEDIAFDMNGVQRAALQIDGSNVHDFVFRRCRFTNMAGPSGAPAAVELLNIGTGTFTDCMWHNPAKFAGFGTAVRANSATSGGRLTFNGHNRILWVNNGIRSESFINTGTPNETTLHSLVVDGAYLDAFWWLIPASNTGQGAGVTYTATSLIDPAANFSNVVAGARPNVVNVRAMPVRRAGAVGTASGSSIIDPNANFAQAGVIRGEIVRSSGRFGIVARDATPDIPTALQLEEWLDDTTLLPTTPPAPGEAYTAFGILVGSITSRTNTVLTIESWRDRHGNTVLPDPGTLYEVCQVRPNYLFFVGPGGVLDLELTNSTINRSWSDMAGIRPQASRIIGNHFIDGQEGGLILTGTASGQTYFGHLIHGNTFDRIGTAAIEVNGSQSVIIGNRITGGQSQRAIATACDISLLNGSNNFVAFNVGDTGVESQTPHPLILNQVTAGTSTGCVFAYNQKVGKLGENDVVFRGAGNAGNQVIGSANVGYVAGATGQIIDATGAGTPEGKLIAAVGSTYRQTDGGAGSTFYVKETGNTTAGWVAK